MTHNYNAVAGRWYDRIMGLTNKPAIRNPRMFTDYDDNRIYSYGSHFELARVLRTAKGAPRGWLLNGDVRSVTTSRHQSVIRREVRGELPKVIIPYSALEAAGLDLDSVEIIDVSADRNETTNHRTTEQPPGSVWRTTDVQGYIPWTDEQLIINVAKRNQEAMNSYAWAKHEAEVEGANNDDFMAGILARNYPAGAPQPKTADELFPINANSWDHPRQSYGVTGQETHLYQSSVSRNVIHVEDQEDGTKVYSWTTYRHWLGESLIKAKVSWSGTTPCKACKGQAGGYVIRCTVCEGDCFKRWHRSRSAYFLSGFDHQETRRVYFLCELPSGSSPQTIAEAYEVLKPVPVKVAEEAGRTTVRQGDIFAIPTALTTRQLRKSGARIEQRRPVKLDQGWGLPELGRSAELLGTNHEATEVAYLPNGVTLARGVLYHNPQRRRPDHSRRSLGKSWHIIIKNTVPTIKH